MYSMHAWNVMCAVATIFGQESMHVVYRLLLAYKLAVYYGMCKKYIV